MFLENFVKSGESLSLLKQALSLLYQAGYFPVALELVSRRAGDLEGPNLIERAAVQRGFSEGYFQAIEDLYNFEKRYVLGVEQTAKVKADFGALSSLVETGQLTKEEADEFIRGSRRG